MKTVLITGATGGIGISLAEIFIKNKFKVILMGRDKSKLKKMKVSNNNVYTFYKCDFQNNEELKHVIKNINSENHIDILINNAGITEDCLFIRMDEEKWSKVIQVNLNANFLITSEFVKPMIKKRWGRIINITSVVAHTGNFGQTNYCSSKSGLIGLSKSLALEVAKRNITVNCIAPGFIDTDMTNKLEKSTKETIVSKIPSGVMGEPHDVSHCALFLASDNTKYITGQTIHVNGGLSMI